MASKKVILSDEQIDKKMSDFETKINNSIESKKMGKVSPAKIFLAKVTHLLKKGLENGVSYKQLSKDIYDVYSFKVSEQTVRAFCRNNIPEFQSSKVVKKVVKKEVEKATNSSNGETTEEVESDRKKSTW